MISEKNKATRILKEVVGYFLSAHLYDLNIHFDINKTRLELTISTECETLPKHFNEFLQDLNVKREIEADEYYNALLGSHTSHTDYLCLGKSIDEAKAHFENNLLTLQIIRYFN